MADVLGRKSPKSKKGAWKYKKIEMLKRRIQIMDLKKQEYTKTQIAQMLGIDESQVTRDIQAIDQEVSEEYRSRITDLSGIIAAEYQKICFLENLCAQRLERTKNNPERGSRFVEEWRKLMERKAKLLGLDSETKHRYTIDENPATKEQRDAAVQAALKAAQISKELKLDEDSETVGSA